MVLVFKLLKFQNSSEVCRYLLSKYFNISHFVLTCEVFFKELVSVFQSATKKMIVKNY